MADVRQLYYADRSRFMREQAIQAEIFVAKVPTEKVASILYTVRNFELAEVRRGIGIYKWLGSRRKGEPPLPEHLPLIVLYAAKHFDYVPPNLDLNSILSEAWLSDNGDGLEIIADSQENRDNILQRQRLRTRERHESERWVKYGKADARVPDGYVNGGYVGQDHSKIPEDRKPSKTMVRKAHELVNSTNERKWEKAAERYYDLSHQNGHLFYEMQTYRKFLFDVGSLIKSHTTNQIVVLEGTAKYGFPIGYSIKPAASQNGREEIVNEPSPRNGEWYPDRQLFRIPRSGTIKGVREKPLVLPVVTGPHPSLEKALIRKGTF